MAPCTPSAGHLGRGNHFAEIQSIEIAEENREIAEAWGLVDGQIVVMIHSGSRAWGGYVSQTSSSAIAKMMQRKGLGTSDPRLVLLHWNTPKAVITST